MNTELISANEIISNGKTIYLYYNDVIGAWMAFGESAFHLKGEKDCLFSYSADLQMLCAVCPASVIAEIKTKGTVIEDLPGSRLALQAEAQVDGESYKQWTTQLRPE